MNDSKADVEDLAAWLTRVWDEEERLAKAAPGRQWKAFVMDDVAGASVYDEQWVLLYPQHYDHDNPLSSDPGATGPMYIERAKDELCAHIAAHDPASVLARIAADRKILALHSYHMTASLDSHFKRITGTEHPRCDTCASQDENGEQWPCETLRLLASLYKGREGWQEAWRV